MIRWYILRDEKPMAPVIHAPDKWSAANMAHDLGLGTSVISVIEYEEVERERTIKRTKAKRMSVHKQALQQLDNTIRSLEKQQHDLFACTAVDEAVRCARVVSVVNGEYYNDAMVRLKVRPRYQSPEAA